MNIPVAITLSCVSLGFGGVAAYLALNPGPTEAAPSSSPVPTARDDSSARIEALERSIAELSDQVAGATLAAPSRVATAGVSDDVIAAAVAAWFERNGAAPPAQVEETVEPGGLEFETAAEALALLEGLDVEESQAIWKRLVEMGLEQEVLALAKEAAELAPNDPEAQLSLGNAYLGLVQQASGPEAGKWATLADNAFDAALEADPEHWEARFTKAVSLSFWPPIFGKQNQAISHFETLIEQQSRSTPSSDHASTHLMLGNMYQQTGQMDKALAAWRSGLDLFPDNEDLRSQLQLAGGGQ